MLRSALLASMSIALLAAGTAEAKVRCSSGTTAFVEGELRIFGVHYSTPDERGFNEYACVSGMRRPLLVGGEGSTTGTASSDTPAFAIASGGRVLGAYEVSDGEGGPSASITVFDVLQRRSINFMNVACCEGVPAFRVTRDGGIVLLSAGEALVFKPRGQRARTLSSPGAVPTDLATWGDIVYWSEGRQPRMTTLGTADTGHMLEPVRLRRRRDACTRARGRVVAASGSVRVRNRPGGRVACRIGVDGRFGVGFRPGDAVPRIVGDRWLLLHRPVGVWVFDSRTGETVATTNPAEQSALLRDGTLAWLDATGRLVVQPPGGQPAELAAAGATGLAAARRAFYWTEAGEPRRYRP